MKYKITVIVDTNMMNMTDTERELQFWLDCADFRNSEIGSIEEIE